MKKDSEKLAFVNDAMQKGFQRLVQSSLHDPVHNISHLSACSRHLSKKVEELGLNDASLNELVVEILNICKEMNSNARNLSGFYNEVSRIQSFDIINTIMNVLTLFRKQLSNGKRRVHFINDEKKICIIKGDKTQIEHCIFQILKNSIESASWDKIVEIFIDLRSNGSKYIIEIKDNGEGIDKDELNHIFEPNFTTNPKNTGMGLTMARLIMEMNNGEIEIKSIKRKGTNVQLIFNNSE